MSNQKNKNKQNRGHAKGNIFARSWFWFKSLSFVKHIFIFYLMITIVGSLLLWMDFSRNANNPDAVSYTNALFTSASAFSDTGLAPLTTATTFSIFGQSVIAVLILVGGVGWFALKVYFFNILFGRPMSFATRDALAAERGSANVGVTRSLIKVAVTILFIIVVIAALVLTLYFYYAPVDSADRYTVLHDKTALSNFGNNDTHYKIMNNGVIDNNVLNQIKSDQSSSIPTGNWDLSIRYGIFHAISAINNAGFDIMGGQSIAGYYRAYGLQFIFIILFVLGGVGYPVIYDTWKKTRGLFTKEKHKFSLFSKISMTAYAIITLVGLAVVFSIELSACDDKRIPGIGGSDVKYNGTVDSYPTFWNDGNYGTNGNKAMALFFNTMSTRNAGFSTINLGSLSHGTMITYVMLMFIGSAPSSTAGGIRTTTMAVIVLGLWSRIRGKKTVKVFNRRLPGDTVKNSYIVFTTALIIVMIATLVSMTSLSSHGGDLNAIVQNGDGSVSQTINDVTGERFNFTEVVFEVGSAFGTTGLSAGVTGHLSLASKLVLILVMFIGQLGVSSSILVWSRKNPKSRHYGYVKQDISIG